MPKTQMITQSQIAERAYEIWKEEGQPHGRDEEHWQRAEAELRDAMSRMKPAPAKRAAKASAKPASKTGKAKAGKAKTTGKAKANGADIAAP